MADLSDAEFAELGDLLEQTPEPYRPLDVVTLDGYLCGVLVQPRLIEPADWLPLVFDVDGAAFPASADPAWRARCEALVMRRYEALRRAIEEEAWFEPILPDLEATDTAALPKALGAVDPVSRALLPWAAGFARAMARFPELAARRDDAVQLALAHIYRHLPAQSQAQSDVRAVMNRVRPLESRDDALDELVETVVALSELTHEERWRVETVRRAAPKVGRNDPCRCGSGKKFKHCHGAR